MQIKTSYEPYYKYVYYVIAILIVIAVNIGSFNFGKVYKLYDNLATPHSGEVETLPKEVIFVLNYVRMNHVKSLRMSPDVAKNRFIAQPLTESIYPIIVTDSAELLISYTFEKNPINCTTLVIEKRIKIANCH
jgi:hypothetical protein